MTDDFPPQRCERCRKLIHTNWPFAVECVACQYDITNALYGRTWRELRRVR